MKEEYGLSRLRALTSVDILSVRPFMRAKRSRIAHGQGGYWLSASQVSAPPYGRRRPGELERGLT